MNVQTPDSPLPLDELVTFAKASKLLPGRPHVGSIHRWHSRGIRGIRLRSIVCAGQRYTTRTWLEEFLVATSGPTDSPTAMLRTPARRQTQIERAAAELLAAGI